MKKFLEIILSLLSRAIIYKYKPEVIAVTGSVGKTSTKNAIATVLRSHFHLRANEGSYNNELGVPLSIIGATAQGKNIFGWLKVFWQAKKLLLWRDKNYPDILVLEFAADHLGDIEKLTSLAKPSVGVLTAIAMAHTEFFKTLENIKKEKSKLIKLLPPTGTAILNLDDANVAELAKTARVKVRTFGLSFLAEARAVKIVYSLVGTHFGIQYQGQTAPIHLPKVLGIGHVSACLAAVSVGLVYELSLLEMAEALRNYAGEPGRMRLEQGIKNSFLVNDTYNASPRAVEAALQVLNTISVAEGARKIVAFGDMLELGDWSEEAHREAARRMMFADYIVLVGKNTHWTYQELKKSGFNDTKLVYLDDSAEAGRHLQTYIKEGDIVLVKGSRGIKMEKIIEELSDVKK